MVHTSTPSNAKGWLTRQEVAIQINDVTLDNHVLAYATDRVWMGLFVFSYTGPMPGDTTND